MMGIIVGAGRIGYNLAKKMEKKHDIIIIEKNIDVYNEINEKLDCEVIHGSGTNTKILEEININKADFFVAATGNDEVNLLSSVYAKEHGIKKIVSKLNNPDNVSVFKKLDINIINPERSIMRFISRMITRPSAQSLVTIGKGNAEILELKVKNKELSGKTIEEIQEHSDKFIIITKYDKDKVIIPKSNTIINYEDNIAILIKKEHVSEISKLILG